MAKEHRLVTGQFVRIEQIPASMKLRFFGFFIDLVIQMAYFIFMGLLNRTFHYGMSDVSLILFVLLPILLYQPLCESLTGGQTLGKYLLKTRVVCVDAASPSIGSFLLRWLLLPIDFFFFGGVAAFTMLITHHRQRLGDLAAGTMVIRLNTYDKVRVSMDEFSYVRDNYQVTIPEASKLTEKQADLIARTLADCSVSRRQRIGQLASKLRMELQLSAEIFDSETLLTVLLSDYRYYDLNTV
jgi:uncharacterized RDD family membrane protein YckC